MKPKFCLLLSLLFLSGCISASYLRKDVQDDSGDRLTVGTVQRTIKIGMPSAEVVQVLGSPNIITTDEERRQVWVYDKISTDTVYASSEAGLKFLSIGQAGAVSKSQRTLTIIIKFDSDEKVRDFAYHSSKF